MKRAAVLVTVKKTGDLPQLQATQRAADAMASWLVQDPKFDIVKIISDAGGRVRAQEIKDAIKALVDRGDIEQLVVYFSGHGVNIRQGEYWLLSEAPDDPDAAVNVDGSIVLARRSTIPHVVFISDACRTAAEGIQAQAVTGSHIFPNDGPDIAEKHVDLLLASALGDPAYEVKDVATTSGAYTAVYTDALVEALLGKHREAMEIERTDDGTIGYVRLWPLSRFVTAEVVRRLVKAGVKAGVSQTPVARIMSEPTAWLARHRVRVVRGAAAPTPSAPAPDTLMSVSQVALRTLLGAGAAPAMQAIAQAADAGMAHAGFLAGSMARITAPGTQAAGLRCGLTIRGAAVAEVFATEGRVERVDPTRVAVDTRRAPALNVGLRLEGGLGVVVPAIRDFVAALTFDEGQLVNVTYEPSETSPRGPEYQRHMAELRALRSFVAASARLGVFRLEGEDADTIARRMQYVKSFDPTMALYAAYAYHGLGRKKQLREMQDYLAGDLELGFFDIALLADTLRDARPAALGPLFPFVPMLAQGWTLLSAYDVRLRPKVARLQQHLRPSLWTLFDAAGAELLRDVIVSGEGG